MPIPTQTSDRKHPIRPLCWTAACLVLLSTTIANAESTSPVGTWETISDVTGKPTSIVEITLEGEQLLGKIEKLILDPTEDQNPLCSACPDKKKDQPIQGLTILWGLKKADGEWNDGFILDPENGKTYGSELRVTEDNQKLQVRGYIGFSLFGRTQVWTRKK